jgi:hypothetical protein
MHGDALGRGTGRTLLSPVVFRPLAALAGGQAVALLLAAAPGRAAQLLVRCPSPGEISSPLFAIPSWPRPLAPLFGRPVAAAFPVPEEKGAGTCSTAMPASANPTIAEARIRPEMAPLKPRMISSSYDGGTAQHVPTVRQVRSDCLDAQ